MKPFPDPKIEPLQPNAALQEAFDEAMEASPQPPTTAPIAIVAIDPLGPPHGFAGQRGTEVHYSASLLKVAAMYAAFELRFAAIKLINELELFAGEVFPTLKKEFNKAILKDLSQHVPQLAGVNEKFLLPNYEQMFSIDPETAEFNFSQTYWEHLELAIAKGVNESAAHCVHGLGFGYLTRVMAEAGFLKPHTTGSPATADGIWLAGDFGFGFPPQRIPCVNDTPVAQATSVRQMARLFALMLDHKLVHDGVSDKSMLDLLADAVSNGHFWLSQDSTVIDHYMTLNSKIGRGPLNNGTQVASEGLIIEDLLRSRLFVVVFQNLKLVQNPASVFAISRIVDQTIAAFPVI